MRQLREVEKLYSPPSRHARNGNGTALRSVSEAGTGTLEAVFTDIDGTLIDTNALHVAAWCDAFRTHGYPVQPTVVAPMIGMGAGKIVSLVATGLDAREGVGKAIAEDHKRRFLNGYLRQARPTPGARELLAALRSRGVRVYVASSARAQEREMLLQRAGVADLVDPPPRAATNGEPDADFVAAALVQAGVDPGLACLIGDTPYDIEAAARAGVCAVAVRCGGWDDKALSGAVAIYDDPSDIVRHLDTWALPAPRSAAS